MYERAYWESYSPAVAVHSVVKTQKRCDHVDKTKNKMGKVACHLQLFGVPYSACKNIENSHPHVVKHLPETTATPWFAADQGAREVHVINSSGRVPLADDLLLELLPYHHVMCVVDGSNLVASYANALASAADQ